MTQSITPALIAPPAAAQAQVTPLLGEPPKGRADPQLQQLLCASPPPGSRAASPSRG